MASANHYAVAPARDPIGLNSIGDVGWNELGDTEQPIILTPEESIAFFEGLLYRSLKQLFSLHSTVELRWEVMHWIFSIPFVSSDYAEKPLRAILVGVARRFRQSVKESAEVFDPSICHAVPIESLGRSEVRFRITEEFDVVPETCSFEHVCIRLGLNPWELQERIEDDLKTEGVSELIEHAKMGVRTKCKSPRMIQDDLLSYNWDDIRYFIVPATVQGLVRRERRNPAATTDEDRQVSLALF